MLVNAEASVRSSSSTPETVRGQAYGTGIQSYLLHGDMERALFDCWLAYVPQLEDPPKTFQARTLNNLLQSKSTLDGIRNRYEVAIFHGEPAIELSFRLNLDERWYYVGYIDAVLREKATGIYGVFECKTTAMWLKDLTPLYRYSGQALGYSIILDQIAGQDQSSFQTPYLVCRDLRESFIPEIFLFPFQWNLMDRLKWFFTLRLDVERLNTMDRFDLFPQRKEGCLKYNKVCPHFGTCQMTGSDRKREIPEDKNEYQFTYQLDEVIKDHVERIG
jgi:hypothetical protein